MTFVKFLFVLLLLVPVAVLMMYYINKLAEEFAEFVKKSVNKKTKNERHNDKSRSHIHAASQQDTEIKRKSSKRKKRKIKKKDKEQ